MELAASNHKLCEIILCGALSSSEICIDLSYDIGTELTELKRSERSAIGDWYRTIFNTLTIAQSR